MSWLLKTIANSFKSTWKYLKTKPIAKASFAIFIAILLKKVYGSSISKNVEIKTITEAISAFEQKLANKEIQSVRILPEFIEYKSMDKLFQAILPKRAQVGLTERLKTADVQYSFAELISTDSDPLKIILIWAIASFLIFYFFFLDRQPEIHTEEKPEKVVKFDDIIGLNQSKKALQEVLQFMKNPAKFKEIGARMRKGILFYGPPGTGKTTLAKACAGEANVPFYSCSASQFCEMYVGVGPKRVRQLFKRAKENAPSIIYIDEIDAIGNRKSSNVYSEGAGSEKNSTINQLLSEMDGFASQEAILVIGSTNRLEMLDSSLLRPGRFDLKIKVPLPSKDQRFQILSHHLKNKIHSLSRDYLEKVASRLSNWSGADLQNLANESVYNSLRNGHDQIEEEDMDFMIVKLT